MNRGTRILVALGLGFVAYRLSVAVITDSANIVTALVLGLIVAGSTWALTGARTR